MIDIERRRKKIGSNEYESEERQQYKKIIRIKLS
jgi:hypothetical protein